jgi:hypothetical protein
MLDATAPRHRPNRDPAERRDTHVGDDPLAGALRSRQRAVRQLERARRRQVELDQSDPCFRRRVQHDDGSRRRPAADERCGFLGQADGDLLGLRAPNQHLCRDLVGRAAADRVVGRVLDQASPREAE